LSPSALSTVAAPVVTLAPWEAQVGAIRVRFGSGRLAEIGELARSHGARSVFLVTDPGVAAAGHPARAVAALEAAGVAVRQFSAVGENPTTATIEAATEIARAGAVELLIGLGGGSALDTAKGVNFLLTQGGTMEDYWGYGKGTKPFLPALGVPTTAGTGSEAQSYALVSQVETHRKMACGDAGVRFWDVILDPELVVTAPRRVIALTALDALSHAVESFVSTRRNPVSALFAAEAWRRLSGAFEAGLEEPGEVGPRGELLLGAHLAGAAIEASMLGAAHALANPLTAAFGVVHGAAVAVMLPAVVRWNAAQVEGLYRELEPGGGEAVARRLEACRRLGGLPERLADLGLPQEALPELAADATREWTGTFNPRPLTEADYLRLYEAAY
jgi:alcohol dehydrogenase